MAIQGFDKNFYLNAKLAQLQSNPETAADWAGKDAAFLEARLENGFGLSAEAHYEQYGYQEGLAPNAFFNSAEYIRAKATEMFNDSESSYLTIDEAAADFEALWNGNVYNHYLQYGEAEGVNPSNDFDVSSYLEAKLAQLQAEGNTEITTTEGVAAAFEDAGLTALEHFLAYGEEENLSATPVPADEQVEVDEEATNPGETFSLTAGADNITGTSGDDTIRALTINAEGNAATTLTAFDEIDGGAGQDTLNLYTGADNTAFPANASVQNVEIVNIFNSAAAVADFADASNFEGVEQLWQVNEAAAVSNLEATTTAGFRETAGDLSVAAAAGVSSASIALDLVSGDLADADTNANTTGLTVTGDSLNSVTVAGELEDVDTTDEVVPSINLDVTAGDDEDTLAINTAVATSLAVTTGANADNSTVNASESTGNIAFTAGSDISAVETGAGNDNVELAYDFSVGTALEEASVATGEGDDTITLSTVGNGDVAVNAGAGDDTVSVATLGGVATGSVIDGGEGTDTLSTNGGTLSAGGYTLLNNVFVNFEELVFTAASTFDASRLTDYTSFTLEATSTVTNVADDQALIAEAGLTATADGYDASGTETVYEGNLDITANANSTVTANASSVDLTVNATAAAANSSSLTGDVETASVSINNYVDENDSTAFLGAGVTITTADTAGTLDALTSLTLSGDGSAVVVNGVDTDLVTVDASELNTTDADGDAATGLTYTSNNLAAETISLGDGVDSLTMNASSVENTDSITGFNLAEDETGTYVGDTLSFGVDTGATAGIEFAQLGEIDANSLDLALVDVVAALSVAGSSDDGAAIFDFGGDSYLFQDLAATGQVDDTDSLLQLVGGVDQQMFVDNAIA